MNIAGEQNEMFVGWAIFYLINSIDSVSIVGVATQAIDSVCRVRDDPAVFDNVSGMANAKVTWHNECYSSFLAAFFFTVFFFAVFFLLVFFLVVFFFATFFFTTFFFAAFFFLPRRMGAAASSSSHSF